METSDFLFLKRKLEISDFADSRDWIVLPAEHLIGMSCLV